MFFFTLLYIHFVTTIFNLNFSEYNDKSSYFTNYTNRFFDGEIPSVEFFSPLTFIKFWNLQEDKFLNRLIFVYKNIVIIENLVSAPTANIYVEFNYIHSIIFVTIYSTTPLILSTPSPKSVTLYQSPRN